MPGELKTDANACPRCGAQVAGKKIAGIWSGCFKTDDGRRFWSGPVYTAMCPNCRVDLEAGTIDEYAEARKFNWMMLELGPPRPRPITHPKEKRQLESVLIPLLQVHAERPQVMEALGLQFADFSIGGSRRSELEKWLFFDEVNDAANRYPGIFLHMGDLTMTWLFFDADDRLQDCFIRAT